MKRRALALIFTGAVLASSCATGPDSAGTLAELHRERSDTSEIDVANTLELAMQSYRRFLEETPDSTMTPEAMRRLADLKIEQQFGIMGDGEIIELPAPELSTLDPRQQQAATNSGDFADLSESDEAFEQRTTSEFEFEPFSASNELDLPPGAIDPALSGPLEAIQIYQRLLAEYPRYERADQVLYQMARAYDEVGQPDDAMAVMDRLVSEYGYSNYLDEVNFRRGEYLFTRRKFRDSEAAYESILALGEESPYYELALYKLGWALYKQEFYDEALERFMALLDYKVSIGYDFTQSTPDTASEGETQLASEDDSDGASVAEAGTESAAQTGAEADPEAAGEALAEAGDEPEAATTGDETRVADTFRVISLSFSNIGGPEVVSEFFAASGRRPYEDRIYANLGEFYLDKLRYQDAAAVYESFVELNPYHRVAPRFSMRVVDIYGEGDFPLLVVEAKKDFATKYSLGSEYWTYFDSAESPEVLGYLKTNLTDLATHYHALYQDETLEEERSDNFNEASYWYREFLASFTSDPESPSINYRLADLLLENEDFAAAATEYERTAYEYDAHDSAAEAGYAAIFAHRENLKVVDESAESVALRATVDSSLRFADAFPEHENADIVLGAAADDLYEMNDLETAIVAGTNLIERYPESDADLRRAAWTVVAHSSFDLERYPEAESAYISVLDFVPEEDEERESLVDNLAASIYQQGDAANEAGDYRAAADHFLRIRAVAPSSAIRSSAEYDAAAALIRLEDWASAGTVLEDFRDAFPEHELQGEVTKQLASVYRQAGDLDRSALEYERVAAEADDPELTREALLLAGELYEDASSVDSALAVYLRYLESFPRPLDIAQETRNRVAGMYDERGAQDQYRDMLGEIVAADRTAGADRTDRSRFLAAQSALVLTEDLFDQFVAVQLTQPFDVSLANKRERMDEALAAYEGLVEYEIGEVTAAATFYIAEIYFDFSQSLLESERPDDLTSAELVDYELAIEEEAFPFEERSIEVHEQNYDLIAAGVFNPWVERSLAKLAEVMPGRYAKSEISSGFMGTLDVYAYQSPGLPAGEADVTGDAESIQIGQTQVAESGDRDEF
ncbi:MAG: tetratricopeptide repeat protein [Gammaproteobacteria bacterium]|jgi:tetratricopeptide (TPR) repeat protein